MGIVNIENNIPTDDLANWFLKKEIKIKGDWAEEKEIDPAAGHFSIIMTIIPMLMTQLWLECFLIDTIN